MRDLNKTYCENCLVTMSKMPDNFIDLTITSPPYDKLRNYKGYVFDFKPIARELYRVTKEGGVIVWVVGDATIKGNETGTSFKQALYFKEIGFNLHDTMIYHKRAVGACGSKFSYNQAFEYMFIFSKEKLKIFNPIKDLIPKRAGKLTTYTKGSKSNTRGYNSETHIKIAPHTSKRQNIWAYNIGFGSGNDKTMHPAVFPEQLVNDHILSWSNKGDLIYDPFMGSGTTAKIALLNNRKYIGSEMSKEYCEIIKKRLENLTK